MAENLYTAISKVFVNLSTLLRKDAIEQGLLKDAAQRFAQLEQPVSYSYNLGTYTIPTNSSLIIAGKLVLTGTQRLTLQGTALLRII